MKRYTRLQPPELCKISAPAALSLSSAAIAVELKRHLATIRRDYFLCNVGVLVSFSSLQAGPYPKIRFAASSDSLMSIFNHS